MIGSARSKDLTVSRPTSTTRSDAPRRWRTRRPLASRVGKPKRAQNYRKATKANCPEQNKMKKQAHRTTDISREEPIPQRAVLTHLLELLGPLELVLPPELSAKYYLKLESIRDLRKDWRRTRSLFCFCHVKPETRGRRV